MHDLAQIEVFAKVAETRSFTAAARSLGVSKATVSKHVTTIEERLGTRLLNRTTRSVNLTEIGARFYTHCQSIMAELEAAEGEVSRLRAEPRGSLRISAPTSFGICCVASEIGDFLNLYPDIEIDLTLNDRPVGATELDYDLAIRISRQPPPNLQSFQLAECPHVVCGAASYFERHAAPRTATDLAVHDCLTYTYLGTGANWHLDGPSGTEVVKVSGPLRANNGDVLRTALLCGLGLGLMPTFLVADDLRQGRLRNVLPAYRDRSYAIYAISASGGQVLPKVRVFIEFLRTRSDRWHTSFLTTELAAS